MSSLASVPSSAVAEVGHTLVGAKWNYRLVEPIKKGTHSSVAFKAEILQRNEAVAPAKWAFIKTVLLEDKENRKSLAREYEVYHKPSVVASRSFRALYDIIGDTKDLDANASGNAPWLVLEWMDCTLEDLPRDKYHQSYPILKAIVGAGLSSLVALKDERLVNTDLKPANILLSNINTDHPIAKIGDLGLIHPEGYRGPAQPFAMRAPEVFQGLGCTHKSTVWALAATLFCWIKPGVFGTPGNRFRLPAKGWCIAKLLLLFPTWVDPPAEAVHLQMDFKLGKVIAEESIKEGQDEYVTLSSFDDEVQAADMPNELRNLFRYLFIPDQQTRPSAAQALASYEFLSLDKAATASMKMAYP